MPRWSPFSTKTSNDGEKRVSHNDSTTSSEDPEQAKKKQPRWGLGILNDPETDEVPGSVLLMSRATKRNEPLGLQHAPARTSSSSLPSPYPPSMRSRSRTPTRDTKKKTSDGQIVLEPQPDDSGNDPLNWPMWRRNAALLSLGFYCMVGGGMTPILAAGFDKVAETYHIAAHRIALTTGLYMMGLGVGSVVMSPTAILFGKRPVYLLSCLLFIGSSCWCGYSDSFPSLLAARVFQGIAVSPVECLPSATIAEIFFLHERAYRLGIYTLLLLGGKNLIPLVSAAIIQSLGWRWVFWIVAIILGFGGILLFLFVPETFWDRTPRPKHITRTSSFTRIHMPHMFHRSKSNFGAENQIKTDGAGEEKPELVKKEQHVAFGEPSSPEARKSLETERSSLKPPAFGRGALPKLNLPTTASDISTPAAMSTVGTPLSAWKSPTEWDTVDDNLPQAGNTPDLHNLNSPWYVEKANEDEDYFAMSSPAGEAPTAEVQLTQTKPEVPDLVPSVPLSPAPALKLPGRRRKPSGNKHVSMLAEDLRTQEEPKDLPKEDKPLEEADGTQLSRPPSHINSVIEPTDLESAPEKQGADLPAGAQYTEHYRARPPRSTREMLKIYHGRLSQDSWFRVMLRPFILFAYPSILWSAMMYSLSVGWLIVLSESVTSVFKDRDTYNFDSIQTGLVYLSPFVGGVLGTAVAGKVSDLIVRFMSRRNDGVYEPEFRLVMAIPVAITTVIGLMGFGWSAQERDNWFVPTFFFGVISFGCSLGSTTAITFAVDSYRQYAGEALVTLNFSKNIFHGLVFSLFFTSWLEADGSKNVFIAIGGIQLGLMLLTVPMYIFGKRARMWTVRKNMMERRNF